MSQNSVSEFQIPNNSLSDSESQTDKARQDVDSAYGYDQKNEISTIRAEQPNEKTIERLNFIGGNIENARNKELDSLTNQSRRRLSNVRMFAKDVSKTLFLGNAPRLNNREIAERRLIDEESKIGASIFGQISDKNQVSKFFLHGHNQEGFYDWYYYHEENLNTTENHKKVTLHYEVRPEGILQYKTGQLKAEYLKGEELNNFVRATEIYHGFVMKDYSTEKISSKKSPLLKSTSLLSNSVLKHLIIFPDNNGKKAA